MVLKFRKFVGICMAIALYGFFATWNLSLPGLHYDEMLFVNAALLGNNGTFILSRIKGIPFMLMPYIGALKSYFYMPIFAAFGLNAVSIRLPVIILTIFSLILCFILLRRYFTNKFASIATILLAISPSFIVYTRLDIGPSAFELFLKILALYLFSLFIAKQKAGYFAFLCIALILGVFNKLNFIWFVNALVAASALIYWKDLYTLAKRDIKALALIILSTASVYVVYAGITLKYGAGLSLKAPYDLLVVTKNFIETLSGTVFYRDNIHSLSYVFDICVLVPLFLFIGISLITLAKKILQRAELSKAETFILWLGIITLIDIVQVYITPQAKSPWHSLTIFPMIVFIAAYGMKGAYDFIRAKHAETLKMLFYACVSVLVGMQLIINVMYLGSYQNANLVWSPKIYDLISYTKSHNYTYVSLDWGIHNQIMTFDSVKDKYREDFWFFDNPENSRIPELIKEYETNTTLRFIAHEHGSSVSTESKIRARLEKDGYTFMVVGRFVEDNQTLYKILAVERIQ